jgi:hypothetical protein
MFIKSLLAFHLFAILALYLYSEMMDNKNTEMWMNLDTTTETTDRIKDAKDRIKNINTMLTVAFVLACIGSAVTLLLTLKGAADRINRN